MNAGDVILTVIYGLEILGVMCVISLVLFKLATFSEDDDS